MGYKFLKGDEVLRNCSGVSTNFFVMKNVQILSCFFNRALTGPIHRYFPVNFTKFLRTPCLQNTSGRLLLIIYCTVHHCNIQTLVIDILKAYNSLSETIFSDLLIRQERYRDNCTPRKISPSG